MVINICRADLGAGLPIFSLKMPDVGAGSQICAIFNDDIGKPAPTEAPLGNVAELLTEEKVALAQRIIDLQPFSDLFGRYLLTAFMSPFLQNSLNEKATGMTAQGIKSAKLKLILMPIPPLAEQKRIVEKCDRLMSLCDTLEAKLKQGRDSSEKLMEVAAKQVLAN